MGPSNAANEANAHLAAARIYAYYFAPFKFGPNFSQARQNAQILLKI